MPAIVTTLGTVRFRNGMAAALGSDGHWTVTGGGREDRDNVDRALEAVCSPGDGGFAPADGRPAERYVQRAADMLGGVMEFPPAPPSTAEDGPN